MFVCILRAMEIKLTLTIEQLDCSEFFGPFKKVIDRRMCQRGRFYPCYNILRPRYKPSSHSFRFSHFSEEQNSWWSIFWLHFLPLKLKDDMTCICIRQKMKATNFDWFLVEDSLNDSNNSLNSNMLCHKWSTST